jgi:hypothetical protein
VRGGSIDAGRDGGGFFRRAEVDLIYLTTSTPVRSGRQSFISAERALQLVKREDALPPIVGVPRDRVGD